ncbi:MAG: CRISPR-associated endonuclease Cas2 [Flavobacteriales bacterium]|nr:CRISPR-associated endonuclease Cas2 [Flavobacteriales bacterium]
MNTDEHLYMILYDVRHPKRWRRLYKLMQGQGEWVQLSVFQCLISPMRKAQLLGRIEEVIDQLEDHVLLMDLGPASRERPSVLSLGKPFQAVKRQVTII